LEITKDAHFYPRMRIIHALRDRRECDNGWTSLQKLETAQHITVRKSCRRVDQTGGLTQRKKRTHQDFGWEEFIGYHKLNNAG